MPCFIPGLSKCPLCQVVFIEDCPMVGVSSYIVPEILQLACSLVPDSYVQAFNREAWLVNCKKHAWMFGSRQEEYLDRCRALTVPQIVVYGMLDALMHPACVERHGLQAVVACLRSDGTTFVVGTDGAVNTDEGDVVLTAKTTATIVEEAG